MLVELKPATLSEHIGTDFDVVDDPAKVFPLQLTHITEHLKTESQETFSLFFHGPLEPFLSQGICKLNHAVLGQLELFLVPVARDEDGFQYESLFNLVF